MNNRISIYLISSVILILCLLGLYNLVTINSSHDGNITIAKAENDEFMHLEKNPHNDFPTVIPIVKIRTDPDSGYPVERGRLEKVGGISAFTKDESGRWDDYASKIPLKEFRRILQCAPDEPDLDGRRGILGFMRLVGVSSRSIEAASAFLETGCTDWVTCRKDSIDLKSGRRNPSRHFDMNVRLVRVIDGKLYYDFPWNMERFKRGSDWSISRLIGGVLEKISDMPNSVFFVKSWDMGLFPGHFPVPAFSHGPTTHHADIPFPWTPIIEDEIRFHDKQVVRGYKTIPDLNPDDDNNWNSRVEKAIFLGALFGERPAAISRQIMMDLSVLHPDLITANFTTSHRVYAYSPSSEEVVDLNTLVSSPGFVPKSNENGPGYLRHYKHLNTNGKIMNQVTYMRTFKYLVVLAGSGSSGRLSTFLANSGAVILLQETEYLYHFSQRLKPWVHYVPLSFTITDLVEKVLWLKSHDAEARQLARNSRAFGLSYLRLEDYYCYVAAALKAFSEVANATALVPYNPKPFIATSGPRKGLSVQEG